MNEQVRNEVLVKHRRETRMQSFGLIIGIATTMFVAMTMMDMFKLVTAMAANQKGVMEVQSAHTGIKHLKDFKLHKQEDIMSFEDIDFRLTELEKLHK